MLSSRLHEVIYRTVESLPPSSITSIAAVLEVEDIPAGDDLRHRLLDSLAIPQERAFLTALLNVWEAEEVFTRTSHIAVALRSAFHTKTVIERNSQTELVWTGPPSGMSFRRTDQALFEVINAAKRNLLLVTFAAYRIPLLRDSIRNAVDRGVIVSFIGESSTESGGKVAFDAATSFSAISDQIQFYVWPQDKRETDIAGKSGALHAKCALADQDRLLLSSANFTEHALTLNMELGLLVRGGLLPIQTREHFRRLLESGYIRRA